MSSLIARLFPNKLETTTEQMIFFLFAQRFIDKIILRMTVYVCMCNVPMRVIYYYNLHYTELQQKQLLYYYNIMLFDRWGPQTVGASSFQFFIRYQLFIYQFTYCV